MSIKDSFAMAFEGLRKENSELASGLAGKGVAQLLLLSYKLRYMQGIAVFTS